MTDHLEPDQTPGELDHLNFDHHREERHLMIETSRAHRERSLSDDRGSRSFSSGSQEVGRYGCGGGNGEARNGGREWPSTETWHVPGPFAGRGPRGYQRADERIREELNDRLTAHGFIDATDIECSVHGGDVTLSGFVDSPETKRVAEHVAEGIQGVHDIHNSLRIRSQQDAERIGAPNGPGSVESGSRTAARSSDSDIQGSRARTQ